MAAVPIRTYPLPGSSLPEYLSLFRSRVNRHPLTTWFILPTKNLARAVRYELQKQGMALLPDRITTIKELSSTILRETDPDMHLLTGEEEYLLIHTLASAFPDIIRLLPDGKLTAGVTDNLRTILSAFAEAGLREIPARTPKLTALAGLAAAYRSHCAEHHLCDSRQAVSHAAELLRAGKYRLGTVLVYGLYEKTPLDREFLDALPEASDELHIATPYANNPRIFPPAENPADTPAEDHWVTRLFGTSPHPPDTFRGATAYPDTVTELRGVLDHVCSLIEAGESAADMMILAPPGYPAVSIADEIIGEFSVAGPDGRTPLRVTSYAGLSLSRYPVIQGLLTPYQIFESGYALADLAALLSSPCYFFEPDRYLSPASLKSLSRSAGIISGKIAWETITETILSRTPDPSPEYRTYLTETQSRLSALIADLETLRGTRTLHDHVAVLRRYLTSKRFPGNTISPEGKRAWYQFDQILKNLQKSPYPTDRMDAGTFGKLLRKFAASTSLLIPLVVGPYTVRIAGFQEAAHIRAKHIFIIGLSAGKIPHVSPGLPLLTLAETEPLGLPGTTELLMRERYTYLAVLLTATENLWLSCPLAENGNTLIPSPFLVQFGEPVPFSGTCMHAVSGNQQYAGSIIAEERYAELPGLCGISPADRLVETIAIETCDRKGPYHSPADADFTGTPLADRFAARYTDDTCFAPTTLENYARCPYLWYLEKHLDLSLPRTEENAESRLLGTVFHQIMQKFFTEYTGPLTREEKSSALDAIRRIAEEEFAKIPLTSPRWNAMKDGYLGYGRWDGVLSLLLDQEIAWAEQGYRTPPEWLERELADVALTREENRPLHITVRPDRVLVHENSFLVLDYKTGKSSYTKKQITDGELLQLPLYLRAVELEGTLGTAEGGHYLKATPRTVKTENPFAKQPVGELIEQSVAHAFRYREGIRAGKCHPSERKCSSASCPARFICRYQSMRLTSPEVPDD